MAGHLVQSPISLPGKGWGLGGHGTVDTVVVDMLCQVVFPSMHAPEVFTAYGTPFQVYHKSWGGVSVVWVSGYRYSPAPARAMTGGAAAKVDSSGDCNCAVI